MPFCSHKCHYCDFYSFVDTRDRQEAFIRRLTGELRAIAPAAGSLRTIFIGGGTPSLLRVDLWQDLLRALHASFDLSSILRGEGEFTVECNPESVTSDLANVLRSGGVDRISMGAQSFHPEHLKTLERLHDPDQVERASEIVRASGIERVSLDLIYAIPGQTLDDLKSDLDRALAMLIEHLSCYELTYEPNTAMTKRLQRGEFVRPPEDLEIEMFELVGSRTKDAGLSRYEISNYAKEGAQSAHNLAYWHQESWLAAGPSASAHVAGHRYKNVPRLDSYLSGNDHGFAPIVDHEAPDPLRLAQEKIMTGLRLTQGLDAEPVLAHLDEAARQRVEATLIEHENLGQLERVNGVWRLRESGLLVADWIAGRLMDAVV